MTQPTYDDANLLLRLYELRREDKMRQARNWFVVSFRFKTVEDYMQSCPPGSEANAYARQVTSYWEMVASFVATGVLNQELLFLNTRELLLCWVRVKPLIAAFRQAFGDPNYLGNLERVGETFAEWIKKTSGEAAYTGWVARVGG
jgi:hypothetical protein